MVKISGLLKKKLTTGHGKSEIVVTSNCQTHGIASSLQLMVPDCTAIPIWSLSGLDFIVDEINSKAHDGFIWLTILSEEQRVTVSNRLIKKPSIVLSIPEIFFDAFHPDMTYVQLTNGTLQESALGHYHSRIALWCFLNQIDSIRTIEAFNVRTFDQLGYFGKFENSMIGIKKAFTDCGLDIDPLSSILSHGNPFMHTFNHPKISVLAAFAESICKKLNLKTDLKHYEVPQVLRDVLLESGPIYPIYPEVGDFFGFQGTYASRRQDGRVLHLEDFISESFEMYSKTPKELFNREALFTDHFNNTMEYLVTTND